MKKVILSILALVFLASLTSAHHSSMSYAWNNLNYQVEINAVNNKLTDYFKYGSYWQQGFKYPIYRDLSVTNNYYFSHGNRLTYNNRWHHNDYSGTQIKVYDSNPKRPIGREHASDRTYVSNCGYADGFYRDCY